MLVLKLLILEKRSSQRAWLQLYPSILPFGLPRRRSSFRISLALHRIYGPSPAWCIRFCTGACCFHHMTRAETWCWWRWYLREASFRIKWWSKCDERLDNFAEDGTFTEGERTMALDLKGRVQLLPKSLEPGVIAEFEEMLRMMLRLEPKERISADAVVRMLPTAWRWSDLRTAIAHANNFPHDRISDIAFHLFYSNSKFLQVHILERLV